MIFNLLLYMGIFFIVGGFSLFLYAETKLRDIDIQLFKLEQKIKKELSNVKNWCSYSLRFLYYLNDLFWSSGVGNDTMSKNEMLEQSIDNTDRLLKIVDKLEQRIATLEKVLASHAKCIGEMRDKNEQS